MAVPMNPTPARRARSVIRIRQSGNFTPGASGGTVNGGVWAREGIENVSGDESRDWDEEGDEGSKLEEGRDAKEMGDGGRMSWPSILECR